MAGEWAFKNWREQPLPKPVNWDAHPEWFNQDTGAAKRLHGPRFRDPDDRTWTWGPTVSVRDVGDYTVLHFQWDCSRHGFGQQERHGVEGFTAWVGSELIGHVWDSLDECLVDMVRFKHEGRRGSSGPRATEYFMRMIAEPEWEN